MRESRLLHQLGYRSVSNEARFWNGEVSRSADSSYGYFICVSQLRIRNMPGGIVGWEFSELEAFI